MIALAVAALGLAAPVLVLSYLVWPDAAGAAEHIEPEWLARFDGPAHGFDRANAMTVAGGAVYVTGDSDDGSFEKDLFVVKYTLAGEEVWRAFYQGPGGGWDRGLAIAVDAAGSVFVTGVSWGGEATGHDAITIKYGPDGDEQWVARYDGPIHHTDRCEHIALDGQGGVVVAGFSYYKDDPVYGLQKRYITLKYDADGQLVWSRHYTGPGPYHSDQPHDLAIDAEGDVYVTGSSLAPGLGWDFATVKYRGGDGQQLWVRRYDHGIGAIDQAFAVAVGPTGEVCVTGSASLDPLDGRLVDVVTIVYDGDGDLRWLRSYNGPAGLYDEGRDVVIDASGNVHVAGNSDGIDTGPDYLLLKYDVAGNLLWEARHDGPRSTFDVGKFLALDAAGNAYLTGTSHHFTIYTDIVTLKFDVNGRKEWYAVHDGPMVTNDFVAGIGLDGLGGVYVAGTSRYANEGVSWDAVTLKYAASNVTAATDPPEPVTLCLGLPAPNPFGAVTSLDLSLERPGRVRLEVHDLRGRRVRVMAVDVLPAGRHRFTWDGRTEDGTPLATGIYLCRLDFGGHVETRRLYLLR